MESPPGTGGGAQGDGMKHKEQLWGPFLLSHTCNKSCGLQSGPASTPNAPRALGTPPRLLGTPCGQATRPQSRCPHSLPRAALLRRPLAAPRGGISVSPPVSPKPCSSPSVTAAAPRAGGGARPELPGVSTRGSPNVTKSARPRAPIIVASGRRDMGGPMGTGTPLSPLPGALPPEKKALPAAPNPVQPHGQGENPCVFPTSCLEHPQISSLFFWGFSQPKPSVRKEQLPSKHRVKGVIGLN